MSTEVNQDLVIRNATEDDVLCVLEILREALRLDAPSESDLLGFLKECPEGFLVAQVGDKIAGANITYIHNGRPHLYLAVTASEFRSHRGIGTSLVAAQLSNFRRLGYREVETMIRCYNTIAIKTGEKNGFKHVRTIRNFYDFSSTMARLMVKPLSDDGKLSCKEAGLWDKAKDAWGRFVEPRLKRGLRVVWFDDWLTELDNALYELPEMPDCPHELFRMVMLNPSPTRKRTALVMKGARPVAVIGLREKGRYWIPVMQEIVPGCIAPAHDGLLFPALRALGVEVRIADWPDPPPRAAHARNAVPVPKYKVDCLGDYERYWRDSTRLKAIKVSRTRTKSFRFDVDKPGSAALVIARWEEKWRDHPEQQTIVAPDLTVAAEYWEQRERWHSFLLMDGDELTAGCTGPARGDTLVYAVSVRDDRYNWHRAGFRLVDLVVPWAAEHGFAKFDVGGWYSYYKAKWGPQDGEDWDFRICPLRQHIREQITWKAKAVPGKLRSLLTRLPFVSGDRGAANEEEREDGSPKEEPELEPGRADAVRPPSEDPS